MSDALEVVGQRLLASCEATIERGLATFVEVGKALLDVREGRLYRETHETFEAYCAERWRFSDRHARRMIEASTVMQRIGPIGPVPKSESVARELAAAPEPAKAWAETVERHGPEPTARQVRDVVEQARPLRQRTIVDDELAKINAAVSEIDRVGKIARQLWRIDWELFERQGVAMNFGDRMVLEGHASYFADAAERARALLKTKLGVVR